MIKFAVCDDEPFMRDDMAALLSDYAEERKLICQIYRFSSGKELLQSSQIFDVLFLDIQMEKPDGMETAEILRKRGFGGLLIFTTVLEERVFDSFEVQAFDYLIKPMDHSRFRRTTERAIKSVEQEAAKSMIIQKGNTCQVILFSHIVYCEVIGRKVYLHRQGGKVTDYYSRLDALERQLDSRFFRCHRSYLVNLDYVCGYHAGLVTLAEGGEIPLSRLREQALTQALLIHMKERRR